MAIHPSDSEKAQQQLAQFRQSIDNLDTALVYILAERFRQTEAVSDLKAIYQMPAADLNREAEQIARLRKLAESVQVSPDFIEQFLKFIFHEVTKHHEMIANQKMK